MVLPRSQRVRRGVRRTEVIRNALQSTNGPIVLAISIYSSLFALCLFARNKSRCFESANLSLPLSLYLSLSFILRFSFSWHRFAHPLQFSSFLIIFLRFFQTANDKQNVGGCTWLYIHISIARLKWKALFRTFLNIAGMIGLRLSLMHILSFFSRRFMQI